MTHLIVGTNEKEVLVKITEQINELFGSSFSVLPHEIADGDVHVLYDSEATSLGVAPAKGFIKELQKKPFKRRFQVGIIPRIDILTVEAQNSLLKELEDHNPSVVYILGALNEHNVLTTILSRTRITYVSTQRADTFEEEITTLASKFQKKTDILSTFRKLQEIEWTKQKALIFLKKLYLNQKTETVRKDVLELLQASGRMLNANIPPRQVLGYILLRFNNEV